MAFEDVLEKLVEKLPYSDGSARRRFIGGAMLAIGVAVPNWSTISKLLGVLTIADLLKTPFLTATAALLVYLAGTIVEMLGSVFLVPAAALLLQALGGPPQPLSQSRLLSPSARDVLGSLPEKIREGIDHPTGKYAELTMQYLMYAFRTPRHRRWCKQLFSRVADIGTTTTAIISVISPLVILGTLHNRSTAEESQYWMDMTGTARALDSIEPKGAAMLALEEIAAASHLAQPIPEPLMIDLHNVGNREMLDRLNDYLRRRSLGLPVSYLSRSEIIVLDDISKAGTEQCEAIKRRLQEFRMQLAQPPIRGAPIRTPPADIERARLGIDKYIPMLEDQARAFAQLRVFISNWASDADRVQTLRAARRFFILFVGAALPALLFLYLGYFVSLRNALLSAIEARAIELSDSTAALHQPSTDAVSDHEQAEHLGIDTSNGTLMELRAKT
jgi:hypothetical protein